ncbi:Uncharacterized protein HZ326_25350 [Fusarium oxysporum f. sp. albedinis]|nr:Uncharacterized protein HZ326_25350 [Fusarium oxysporum f. sp. albedinis]
MPWSWRSLADHKLCLSNKISHGDNFAKTPYLNDRHRNDPPTAWIKTPVLQKQPHAARCWLAGAIRPYG